ncbi:unnamed protein product [Nesidiocoris tenuis]|uniref:Uncharacterized protein n=1 Tax=Nesidiocoris tenuis TaxID=355587 RepID=A0A6H5G948_9HEMI|nr:unnamed protein product [Nesidiocoris tenuis]
MASLVAVLAGRFHIRLSSGKQREYPQKILWVSRENLSLKTLSDPGRVGYRTSGRKMASKQREERERQFQRKKRLENARRVYLDFINDPKAFNLGVKYSMIDQMSEELAQYLDMVDCRRILTGMLEFVYDPSTRPEDPVDYFASLTKDRKIDKRELNKARRYLYQLMWKEYEIREEIEKLKTLLNLTSPRDYKPDGTERTEEEKAKYDLARRRYSSMQRDLLISFFERLD